MPTPILVPGATNALVWENMTSVSDQQTIEDADCKCDLLDASGIVLESGMQLTHTTAGNYYGSTPTDLPLDAGEFYFLDYHATRPSGEVGRTRVLCQASHGAAPVPSGDYETRLLALRDNILKILETLVGYDGCPKPDYKIEGFEMDWGSYRAQLMDELKAIEDLVGSGGHFELPTPAGAINPERWRYV